MKKIKKSLSIQLREARKRIAELETENSILESMWRYYRDKDFDVQKIENLEAWIVTYKNRLKTLETGDRGVKEEDLDW